MGFGSYRRALAHHIEVEARKLPYGKTRKSVLKRAWRLPACGATLATFKCGGCGELAPGHGELTSAITDEDGRVMPCKTRGCPACGRRRSNRRAAQVMEALGRVDLSGDNFVSFWTFTARYDPSSEEQLSAEGIRRRTGALAQAVSRLWSKVFKKRGCIGMASSIELGARGLVHVHAIVVGPFVPKGVVEAAGRLFCADFGHTWVEKVKGTAGAAREVTKYSLKSAGPRCEGWLAGEPRECVSPELAARWEVATLHLRLYRGTGIFLALKSDEADDPEAEAEAEAGGDETPVEAAVVAPPTREESIALLECPCCAAKGRWVSVWIDTEAAVRALHARRLPALWGSRWEPSADDH